MYSSQVFEFHHDTVHKAPLCSGLRAVKREAAAAKNENCYGFRSVVIIPFP